MGIEIYKRPIAITDVETTGLDPQKHEIVEIGLVLIDQETGEVIDTFDWSFILEAFKKAGQKSTLDYHRLDLFTLIWTKTRDSKIESFNLNRVAQFLGLPEETLPHRAINGARTAHEIFKKIINP